MLYVSIFLKNWLSLGLRVPCKDERAEIFEWVAWYLVKAPEGLGRFLSLLKIGFWKGCLPFETVDKFLAREFSLFGSNGGEVLSET